MSSSRRAAARGPQDEEAGSDQDELASLGEDFTEPVLSDNALGDSEAGEAEGEEMEAGSSDDDDDDDDYDDDEGARPLRLPSHSFQRLSSEPPQPLTGDLADELQAATSHTNPRWPTGPQANSSLDSGNVEPGAPSTSTSPPSAERVAALRMLRRRDTGTTGAAGGALSPPQRRHVLSQRALLPSQPLGVVDKMDSRAYIGQFSGDGSLFIAAFQTARRVRVYAVEPNGRTGQGARADGGWRRVKDVYARGLRWTVTDTALSPDQRLLLYSTISDRVSMVNLATNQDVYSEANVTDIHEELNFGAQDDDERAGLHGMQRPHFGIWAIKWSPDGTQVVASTNNDSICLFDVQQGKTVAEVSGHTDDVNAVAYLDHTDGHVIVSGSDDRLVKVWDTRMIGGRRRVPPVGVLAGHTEGVTHIDSRGDGHHLISNSKDQTIKLWDVRMALSAKDADQKLKRLRVPSFNWDYRWMPYPATGYDVRHPADCSVQTYRGHSVLQTLSRAYFSPRASTAGRFIYAGSSNGAVKIWDVVTARPMADLRYHHEVVRDCHWHPWLPLLVSTSFDGHIVRWGLPSNGVTEDGEPAAKVLPANPGCDQLRDW